MNKLLFPVLIIALLSACTSLSSNGDMYDGLPPRFLTYIDWNSLQDLDSQEAAVLLESLDLIKKKHYFSAYDLLDKNSFYDPDFYIEALLTRNYIINNFSIITKWHHTALIDVQKGKHIDDYDERDYSRIWPALYIDAEKIAKTYPEHGASNFFAGYFISQEVLKYGSKHLVNEAFYTNVAPLALEYFKKAIELDAPFDAEAMLGACYLFNNNYDLAEEYYMQSYTNFENYNALSTMCLAQIFNGKADQALENLDFVEPLLQDQASLELAYGTRIAAYARLNRFNEAKKQLADYLNTAPENMILKAADKVIDYITGADEELLSFIKENTSYIPLALLINEQFTIMGRPEDYVHFVKEYSDDLKALYKGNETSLQWYYFWANIGFIENEDYKSLRWSFEQMADALDSDVKSVYLWPFEYIFLTKQFTFRMFED